jgi:hypothetical protein
MQRTPSSIGNRTSSSVHQADRSPYQIITHYSNELHAKPTDNVQQLRRQRRRHPPHLTREPCTPRCHFGYPAFDECNALRLPSVTERRLPSTKRTVVPHQVTPYYPHELRAKPTDDLQQLRRQPRRRPHHLAREPCEPWCNSGHPASDECNALRLPSVTERRLPSTKRTAARTKSSRTTQTSCAQSQPTTCTNGDGNRDDDLRTSPGSHASLGAIPVIRPSTDATHAVFHR